MSATPLLTGPGSDDLTSALQSAAPFSDLPGPVLKALAAVASERAYPAGEAVFSLGQYDGEEFYFVAEGRLRAAFADPRSHAVLIEDIPAGGFFGLPGSVIGEEAEGADSMTLTAQTDARVVAIDAALFRAIVAQRPSLTRNLMHYFARCLAAGTFRLGAEESAPERRVFAALLEYAERDAVSGAWRIARMPKHRELAEKAGADEAAAASAIALLIQEGVARRDYPGLVIDDIAQLSRLAE